MTDKTATVRIDKELKERLKEYCVPRGKKMSFEATEAIKKHLNQKEEAKSED